jgi:hypothetical protein
MATTPNFNWSTPDNTGLVKNGALDIRTLGNSIDASLVDLKGGTTGQVLAKATNTDMDFTWSTPASGGGMTLLSTTTLSGSSVTISSISQSYQTLLVYISAATSSADYQLRIIPNNTSSICTITGTTFNSSQAAPTVYKVDQGDLIPEPTFLSSNTANAITCEINNYASTTSFKTINYYGGGLRYNSHRETFETSGLIRTTTAISSLVITTSGGGSFSAGTVLVYGVK